MQKKVGYLVAEFPVVSETFVYREIRSLKALDFVVELYCLRKHNATEGVDFSGLPDAKSIYGVPFVVHLIAFAYCMFSIPTGFLKALSYLSHDIIAVAGMGSKIKLVFQFLAGCTFARRLKGDAITHLHVHFIHSPAQVAMYACALANIPFTVTAHANDIYSQGKLLKEKADRAKLIFTISEFNRRHFESLGIAAHKIRVMRCILDLPEPSDPVSKLDSVYRIGSLGRLVPKKGFATLIKAFGLLVKTHPEREMRLEIAGGGPQQKELEALISQLGLSRQVSLLGPMHQKQVVDWMSGLDCFALACEEDKATGDVDGIPVVLMEAMACGTPVISTSVSGVPELVINGDTGLLAEPGEVDGVSRALSQLLDVPGLSSQLIGNARKHLDSEFSKSVNIERLMCAFID